MPPWGDVRWIGPALSRTTTADTFRVWRWTDDEVAQRHIDDLRDPPGTTEAGLALTQGDVPLLALARNPARDADHYMQRVMVWDADRWVPTWELREDARGATLLAGDAPVARWDRRTRGRVRDTDRFVVGTAAYQPAQLQPAGRWGWTLPLTGLSVADEEGTLIQIGGRQSLTRNVDSPLPVDVRRDGTPGMDLLALTLAVLASVWDTQAAATAG